ncbi:MAG: PD-(D/E)XK nuclease family transposase [Blautia producta]|nr:PD-(D/E)XK nuclease family transposase [Bacillota bacterium]
MIQDIQAEDGDGKFMDIEIQRSDRGSGVKRARFHSSMIDRALLSKGEDFEDLVDTYVIFITENDKFGMGIPLYHVERRIAEMEYS